MPVKCGVSPESGLGDIVIKTAIRLQQAAQPGFPDIMGVGSFVAFGEEGGDGVSGGLGYTEKWKNTQVNQGNHFHKRLFLQCGSK